MDGRKEIRDKLISTVAVTDIVGTFDSQPAIFASPVIPSGFEETAISIYQTAPTDGGLSYGNFPNTVSCFSQNYNEAEDLQEEVFKSLNRNSEEDTFFVCSKQIIIPPPNTGGEYNAPVEVLVRQR